MAKRDALKRLTISCVAILVIALGLSSRRHQFWPDPVKEYAGDALYAVLIYLLALLALPEMKPHKAWSASVTTCFLIEFSQAIHWGWLDQLRSNRFVALVLGQGFVWSDLVLYVLGATGAYFVHRYLVDLAGHKQLG